MQRIYLDNAPSTPISNDVIDVMKNLMESTYGNPSSVHSYGRQAKIIIEDARKKIAQILNTSPGTIFFTSGGTESDNMAINSSIKKYNIRHAITSKISHHAVLYPLQELANDGVIELSYVDIDNDGKISVDHLETLLKEKPRSFVSIMHANNEIGIIQDIKTIGELCKAYNAIFHSDTVQTVGHYLFNMQDLDLHFMAASAHKFHGPKGIGFIYISEELQIKPYILGGSQERNMRAGTESIYLIAGLAKAMEIAYENLSDDTNYIKGLKLYMINLLESEFPMLSFNGCSNNLDQTLYTVLNISLPKNSNTEMLLFNLDIEGISCSGGSACASGTNMGSHVLSFLNPESNRIGIRFSFSKYNSKEDINYTVKKLKELYF